MKHQKPTAYNRVDRVADQMQRELAQLLQWEVKDPRIGMVTISSVKVARDFSYADIYITAMKADSETERKELLKALDKASGFLRSQLANLIRLRVTPKLRFHYDETIERGAHLSALITRAIDEDSQHGSDDDSAADNNETE